MKKLWLYDMQDNPVREATEEEVKKQEEDYYHLFTIDGKDHYAEPHNPNDDNWREEWRQEIAREEGMLGGVQVYNDWMGY